MDNQKQKFILDLALIIRDKVIAAYDKAARVAVEETAFSGDTTFAIDKVAEQALADALKNSDQSLAYFSEDRGLVKLNPSPDLLLVVDPIDGTRPLICGLATSVVSIALCPYSEVATFGSIMASAVVEIHSGDWFYAERGQGLDSSRKEFSPSTTSDVAEMFWNFDTIGRPAQRVMRYLAPLMDKSGMKGAPFLLNSAAFSLTRIITGKLDAYVDVGGRVLSDEPESGPEFLEIGNGRIMGTFPYDLAAAYLLVQEAGCILTDAHGKSIAERFLLRTGEKAIMSCVAASNSKLHHAILEILNEDHSN